MKIVVKQALEYYDVIRDNRTLLRIARQQAELLKDVQKKYPDAYETGFDKAGLYIIDEKKVSDNLAQFLKKYYPQGPSK